MHFEARFRSLLVQVAHGPTIDFSDTNAGFIVMTSDHQYHDNFLALAPVLTRDPIDIVKAGRHSSGISMNGRIV